MKKILLFIVAALFVAVSANAQDENNALVSLLKVNFEGVSRVIPLIPSISIIGGGLRWFFLTTV